jgi:hypothetical protein
MPLKWHPCSSFFASQPPGKQLSPTCSPVTMFCLATGQEPTNQRQKPLKLTETLSQNKSFLLINWFSHVFCLNDRKLTNTVSRSEQRKHSNYMAENESETTRSQIMTGLQACSWPCFNPEIKGKTLKRCTGAARRWLWTPTQKLTLTVLGEARVDVGNQHGGYCSSPGRTWC